VIPSVCVHRRSQSSPGQRMLLARIRSAQRSRPGGDPPGRGSSWAPPGGVRPGLAHDCPSSATLALTLGSRRAIQDSSSELLGLVASGALRAKCLRRDAHLACEVSSACCPDVPEAAHVASTLATSSAPGAAGPFFPAGPPPFNRTSSLHFPDKGIRIWIRDDVHQRGDGDGHNEPDDDQPGKQLHAAQ
jgi:hypothetical protein